MPLNTTNPLTGYVHGNLLEEGCIELTKTVLEKGGEKQGVEVLATESGASSDEEEEEVRDHENLHLKWTWTEVKR
jgi:hypothetical protein